MKKIYSLLFAIVLAFVGAGSVNAREYAAGADVYVDELQKDDVIEYGVNFKIHDMEEYELDFYESLNSSVYDFILDGDYYCDNNIYSPGLKFKVYDAKYEELGPGWAQYTITLYPAAQETTQPASVAGYDGHEFYYGTYYANYSWKVPEGYEALIVSKIENGAATLSLLASAGQVIPANKGVLLRGIERNTNITIEGSNEDPVECGQNYLEGVTKEDEITRDQTLFYKLAYKAGTTSDLGFYYDGKASLPNGASILAQPYKAYLAVPKSLLGNSNALALRFDDDTITAIETISAENNSQCVHDLWGKRANNQSSIVIKEGKKMLMK